MDLLQTVRKEGSRGGRNEFSWQDVQNDPHRQNYLGHSLMAPVGRWQKGKDLNWYARGDQDGEMDEAAQRREEMRKIKQQEEDEMLRAMGMPVPDRDNANLEPVGVRVGRDVEPDKRERSRSPERKHARQEGSDRRHDDGDRKHRRRRRSRDDDRDRYHRSRRHDDDRDRRRTHRHRERTSRSRSTERRRHRSRSPAEKRDRDGDRRRRYD